MARSVKEIQQQMLDRMAQEPAFNTLEILTDDEQQNLQNLTSQSRVSAWRKMVYVIALAIYFFEVIMDTYESRVQAKLDAQRVHKISYYQDVLRNYQHGAQYDELGQYDNTGRTATEIEQMRVFKHVAITREVNGGFVVLRAKVAGEAGGQFTEVDQAMVTAATPYLEDNADAGTLTRITTGPGDDLKLEIDIYIDPTIIDSDGKRVDGTNDTPVLDATIAYLQQQNLNDMYVKGDHEAALRAVPGVEIAEVIYAASKYAAHTYDSTSVSNAGRIIQRRVAYSGYFIVDEPELIIHYKTDADV